MTIAEKLQRVPMTRAEFDRLPEGPPFYDYVHGEAIEVNRPTIRHQQIVFRLANQLWEYAEARDLGLVSADTSVELPNGNVYGPDVLYLRKEHLDRLDPSGYVRGIPDLAVEVLSRTTASYDRTTKLRDYQQNRIPWVWIIDQDTLAVEEYQWTPDGYLWIAGIAPGELFRPALFPELVIDFSRLIGDRQG